MLPHCITLFPRLFLKVRENESVQNKEADASKHVHSVWINRCHVGANSTPKLNSLPRVLTHLSSDVATIGNHAIWKLGLADWRTRMVGLDRCWEILWLLENSLATNSQKLLRVRKLYKRFSPVF